MISDPNYEYHSDKEYTKKPLSSWNANDWADIYRYEWGINAVPSNGAQKYKGGEIPAEARPPAYQIYYDQPIPELIHESWKKKNAYDNGIMKLTGTVWHRPDLKDEWHYCSIDMDNQLGVNEVMNGSPLDVAGQKQCIEWHDDNPNKCHWDMYIRKKSKLQKRASDMAKKSKEIEKNEIPAIEIKVGRGLMFGCPSQHKEGRNYQYIGRNIPLQIDGDTLQSGLENIFKKYSLNIVEKSTTEQLKSLLEQDGIIQQGQNRQLGILTFVDSMCRRTWNLGLGIPFYEEMAMWFSRNHIEEGYTEEMIKEKARSSVAFVMDAIRSEDDGKYSSLSQGILQDGLHSDMSWLIEFYLKKTKIISKTEIMKKLIDWLEKVKMKGKEEEHAENPIYDVTLKPTEMKIMIESVFNRKENFEWIKSLAIEYGKLGADTYFDSDQHIELSIYLTERYKIKKIGLDGSLIYFTGKYYSMKTEAFLPRKILDCTTRIKKTVVDEVLAHVKNYAPVVQEDIFEKHEHIIVFENGTYNIKTGDFSSTFNSENLVRRSMPHTFDESASFEEAEKILKAIFNTDRNYLMFLDYLSMCIYPSIGLYKMYVLLSPPGTGKKQVSTFIRNLFSPDNVTHFSIQEIVTDPTDRIAAARSMINIDEDMGNMTIKDVGWLLKWVTMDKLSARAIYGYPVTFRPSSRLMANSNVLFDVTQPSHMEALNDRTNTTQLEKRFRGTEGNIPDIVNKMFTQEHYNAYMTFILKNATILYKSQELKYANSSMEEKMIWDEFSGWIMKFCKIYMVKTPDKNVNTQDVWTTWIDYSTNRGVSPGKPALFMLALQNYFHIKTKMSRDSGRPIRVYPGYALKPQSELNEEERM